MHWVSRRICFHLYTCMLCTCTHNHPHTPAHAPLVHLHARITLHTTYHALRFTLLHTPHHHTHGCHLHASRFSAWFSGSLAICCYYAHMGSCYLPFLRSATLTTCPLHLPPPWVWPPHSPKIDCWWWVGGHSQVGGGRFLPLGTTKPLCGNKYSIRRPNPAMTIHRHQAYETMTDDANVVIGMA